MYLPFHEMPETARVWIYQADRKFDAEEIEFVKGKLTSFCEQWNTHGASMPTSFDLQYGRIIILAVDVLVVKLWKVLLDSLRLLARSKLLC